MVLCRIIVATCDEHWAVDDVGEVDDSACDKDDKPRVWRLVSRYCNSQNFANSAGTPVSLPVGVLENSLHRQTKTCVFTNKIVNLLKNVRSIKIKR